MVQVSETIQIPDSELDWSYARSGGPGGQNVNKVASKAVLRWAMASSLSVPSEIKSRLAQLSPSRITSEGDLVIMSQEYRDQERNRQACVEKLISLLQRASHKPTPRRPTRPSKGSKLRRLATKKHQASKKAERKVPRNDE